MATCKNCELPTAGNSKYCAAHRQAARQGWVDMIKAKGEERQARLDGFEDLYNQAHLAGQLAAQACVPRPMVVQQHANPGDDGSRVVKEWDVPDGVCGFAWVVVNPGNSSFALWLKKHKGAHRHYYGGVAVSVRDYGQSLERKSAYADAFATVLQGAGIKARADSRMD